MELPRRTPWCGGAPVRHVRIGGHCEFHWAGSRDPGATVMTKRTPLWVWWIALTWLISLPWSGFTLAPQWSRVHRVPFTDPADRPRDFVLNVLFFVPFGYSFARTRRRLLAPLAAALVSLSAEATQLFGTVRYPSTTDVSAAIVGAALGAIVVRWAQPLDEIRSSHTP